MLGDALDPKARGALALLAKGLRLYDRAQIRLLGHATARFERFILIRRNRRSSRASLLFLLCPRRHGARSLRSAVLA